MLEQAYGDARDDTPKQYKVWMRCATMITSKAVIITLALVLTSGCQKPSSDLEQSAADEETLDAVGAGEQAEAPDAESAGATDSIPLWTLQKLRATLDDEGWSIDSEVPALPDVATPEGTDIDGLTVQKEDLRADVFLYHYPREGYAQAHASVEYALEHTAILQQGTQLFVVVSRDRAQARAVLEALPLGETP